MKNPMIHYKLLQIAFWLVALGFLLGLPLVKSVFEARAYNRITGAHVTWWDALFLELRIDANPSSGFVRPGDQSINP